MDADLDSELRGSSNVLLFGSMMDDTTKRLHNTLLARETAGGENVLAITFQSPTRWLRTWTDAPEDRDGDLRIVAFDESSSSAETLPDGASAITISPRDLTGLGMKLSDYLSDWARNDARTTICFDSVTELLQYTDPKSLFRFLRVITRRIEHVDGLVHFHMDPSAHDSQMLATMQSPFDAVVETRATDGDVLVSTRY